MTLGDSQRLFALCMSKFLPWLHDQGYAVVFGEVQRSDEQAEINALGDTGRKALASVLRMPQHGTLFKRLAECLENNVGSGIRNTLHELCLAADLKLFFNGQYLTKNEEYKKAGEYWESLHPLCRWGGRFGDGNHFSITYDGRR